MKKNLETNINFWKILAIYNAYDPLERLPNISAVDEYATEVERFLEIINSKKIIEKNINEIHEDIFESQLDEGLILLLKDEIANIFPKKFKTNEFINKESSNNNSFDSVAKIKLDTKKKINYLQSTGNFNSFSFNNKRVVLKKFYNPNKKFNKKDE